MRVIRCDKCGREFDPDDREGAKSFRFTIWTGPKIEGDLCTDCAIPLVDIIKEYLRE